MSSKKPVVSRDVVELARDMGASKGFVKRLKKQIDAKEFTARLITLRACRSLDEKMLANRCKKLSKRKVMMIEKQEDREQLIGNLVDYLDGMNLRLKLSVVDENGEEVRSIIPD